MTKPKRSVTIIAAWMGIFGVLILAIAALAVPFIEHWLNQDKGNATLPPLTATQFFTQTISAPTVVTSTISPTPSDEEQRINQVNRYFICINGHNKELETCWTDLPEEYQTQYNTYNSGAGLATFISKWRGYYLTYTMHYCQNISGTHYVDAVIDKRDLSTQITTGEIGEFFFGINDKGWYIKNIIFLPGKTELSSDCDKEPITPTP